MADVMYPYEGMFLLDPVAHAADPQAVQKSVVDLLEKHGGKIHKSESLEERRLAYPIKGHRRGSYFLVHFEMPGANVDGMRKESRITETILRQLVIRLPWDIPEYLERSTLYYEKMREDQENRRSDRGGHDDAPIGRVPAPDEIRADDAAAAG